MKTLTQSAQTAKAIRELLKKKFPTVKFSVTSDNFSMGNSVDVRWNLGPTTKQVDDLIRDFQYGHFDGMNDIYEYSNSRDDIPQAKWVHSQREYYTQEEIDNNKLGWKHPERRDLYKEEKTLNHIVMKDLCKAMNIEYNGEYTPIPETFHVNATQYNTPCLRDLVYSMLSPVEFMHGYHGIRNKKMDDGTVISNMFEAY